jgi:hypothetical protein
MTIDSSWIACFKEELPHAFTKFAPFRPKAVFCDGQIRLMRGYCEGVLTWDRYVWQQFHSHVQKFYDTGASTVILAFDDYAHVPEAKCMTQLKRRRHLPKLDILEREPLPSTVPSGERWEQCIANRTFKAKVIGLVVQTLPALLNLTNDRCLIIDYAGVPTKYTLLAGQLHAETLDTLLPLGEADVKFTRYADLYQDLLVDSVDGDSIPIALLHNEACVRDLTSGTMRVADLTHAPPRIAIYRMTTRIEPKAKDEPSKRTFEYVNLPALYAGLRDIVAQCIGRASSPTHEAHYMSMLLALIGLTGTDFTRGMPQLSGKSVFHLMPDVWMPLMRSYNPHSGQLDVPSATDTVVAGLYSAKYATHIRAPPPTLHHALQTLRECKLSQRTKDSLPSADRVACTVRNVNWLLLYWRQPLLVPDPLTTEAGVPRFGYVKRKGCVAYSAE